MRTPAAVLFGSPISDLFTFIGICVNSKTTDELGIDSICLFIDIITLSANDKLQKHLRKMHSNNSHFTR